MQPSPAAQLLHRLRLLSRLGLSPRNPQPPTLALEEHPDEAFLEWTTHPADLRRIIQFRRVLDLGCGTGSRTTLLARQGYVVDALEGSATALDAAQQKAREAGVAVNFHHTPPLHFRDVGPYDLVIDYGCFHRLTPETYEQYRAFLRQRTSRGSRLILRALIPRDRDPVEGTFAGLFEALDQRDVGQASAHGPFRLRAYHMVRWE